MRKQLKKEGKETAYQFMVRVRIVGGKLTRRPVPGLRPPGPDHRQRQRCGSRPARNFSSTAC